MINLSMADPEHNLRPRLTVIGVGGAGGNAINNMIRSKLEGCDFIAANTDSQALAMSLAGRKIQLGVNLSRGLGAGSKADVGRAAAEEQTNDIMASLEGSDMLFVTAGMGGGTGTGAAPVIARAARESGILTVGVVTKPFHFEGNNRMRQAEQGIAELQQYVDTLLVIPNQNLFRIANERTTFAEAFRLADEVLYCGVRGITDLMVMPGFMNLDFADVKTVMGEMGKAMMGTGEAEGDDRAVRAAEAAISNPLLDDVSMKGARGVLINITGGLDMTLFEVDQAANRIREEVDPEAQIKVGSTLGESLEGKIRVSVIATGIDAAVTQRASTATATAKPRAAATPQTAKPQQLQTNYGQPAYPAAAAAAPATQPEAQASTQTQTSYFTMPQAIMPHSDVIPRTQPIVDTSEPEVQARPESVVEREPVREEPLAAEPKYAEPEPRYEPEQRYAEPAPRAHTPPVETAPEPRPAPAPLPEAQQRSSRPSSPMAQNDMRMTQLTPQTHAHQPGQEQRRQRRAESLFTRITGFGLVRPSSQHHEEEIHDGGDDPMSGPHLDVRSSDRPMLSEQPEDLLEIPAFLRRQSNH
ncbi:MAG: cell division protein FtsZ [Alphaproteobacteria bacterium]|nr:cell division protein FtsZ [Alphaproteobacteria bacterium]